MPWQEVSTMSLRQEFITMVQRGTVRVSELCRRYGVSRKTGYKWLQRYRDEGTAGLTDRSRPPTLWHTPLVHYGFHQHLSGPENEVSTSRLRLTPMNGA